MADHSTIPDDEIMDEYDLAGGERGKYAEHYARGTNLVLLDADVAAMFPDPASVNRALREYAEQQRNSAD